MSSFKYDGGDAALLLNKMRDDRTGLLFFLKFFWSGWDSIQETGETNDAYDKYHSDFGAWHEYAQYHFMKPSKLITSVEVMRAAGKSAFTEGFSVHSMFLGALDHYDVEKQPVYATRDFVVIISHSKDEKSSDTLENIEAMINKPLFKEWFPWEKGSPWTADNKTILYNGRTIRLRASGAKQAFVGMLKGAARPDLIIMDDLTDPEWAKAPDPINHTQIVVQRLMKSWMPSLSKKNARGVKGRMYNLGTSFYVGDFMSEMKSKEFKPIVNALVFPALADERTAKILNIKEGDSIFESMHPKDELEALRDMLIGTGQEAAWLSQYMMIVRGGDVIRFREERIQELEYTEVMDLIKKYGCNRKLAIVDMAYTKNSRNDSTAASVFFYLNDPAKRVVCMKTYKKTMEFVDVPSGQIRDNLTGQLYDGYSMFRLIANEFGTDIEIHIESLSYKMITALADSEAAKHHEPLFNMYMVKDRTHKNKDARINGIVPWVNTGKILFVRDEWEPVREEMKIWRGVQTKAAGKDDALDTFGYIPNFIEIQEEYKEETTVVDSFPVHPDNWESWQFAQYNMEKKKNKLKREQRLRIGRHRGIY